MYFLEILTALTVMFATYLAVEDAEAGLFVLGIAIVIALISISVNTKE